MNEEVFSLYQADRQERAVQLRTNTPEYKAMRARDLARRVRLLENLGNLKTAQDFYHAAWIMNHGDTPADVEHAHKFALRASELGYEPARWLAAASYDRWQMYQGKPQKYGTNYVHDGWQDRLWETASSVTKILQIKSVVRLHYAENVPKTKRY